MIGRSDGLKWECTRKIEGNRHYCEVSIRKDSFFSESNLSIEEIIKFTYWWCHNLTQSQIKTQLGLGSSTSVDWDMFCGEVCEIMVYEEAVPLGGFGKTVQIDESKVGKRKYNRGHRVEGQWMFRGIEEDSRNSFIIAVDRRNEETLLPLIKFWIKPGTKIVCDCWKAYTKLEENGCKHETVNHSKEYGTKTDIIRKKLRDIGAK